MANGPRRDRRPGPCAPLLYYAPVSGFRRSRRSLLVVCAAALALAVFVVRNSAKVSAAPPEETSANVVRMQINGDIEPILAEYIVNGIEQANRDRASLILITINTPGGLDTSMREIIKSILNSSVPVVTYVYPTGSRAASAGFFILLSADVAAMAPGTDTGAASPVAFAFGQEAKIDDTMHKKITNEATAYLRSYVEKRNRNPDLAATAVLDAKAFSAKEALDGHLVDFIAASPEELLSKLDGRTITRFDGSTLTLGVARPIFTTVEMTAREKFLVWIVQPDIFFILLIGAALGIYTEFTHPGLYAPGVFGAIAAVLAIISMQMLPVNIAGLLLIVLALALFVLEAKYPTHGVLGVGGVIALVLGGLFLIRSPWTGMGVSLGTSLGVAIPFGILAIVLMRFVMRSRNWKLATGKEELLSEEGEVTEAVAAASADREATGMVRIHGELWRAATAAAETIPKGARVRVRKVIGLTLEVEPVSPRPNS
jgi:membrane-bound serine protease (ClpP class)